MSAISETNTASEFATTHWSDIQAARTATPEHRQAVLGNLAKRYWKPVYCYLRAKGHQDADARDITQDFFMEVVLGRNLFGQAEPHRGRFRPYLLHSLKNFVRERHRREHARHRLPERQVLSIDQWVDSDSSRYLAPAVDEPPEEVFHRKWATSLLEQVLDRLYAACEESGLSLHLEIFRQRIVRPALERVAPVPLEELARRCGLTPKQVSNRTETVRRRFRRLLLEEVRLTVTDETAAEEELRLLMGHLTRRVG